MTGKPVSGNTVCPRCGEAVMPEDQFCYRCGRRLESAASSGSSKRWMTLGGQIAAAAVVLFVVADVAHQQIHWLSRTSGPNGSIRTQTHKSLPPLHPVLTTTTIYPPNWPTSAHLTPEVETYQNVTLSVAVPSTMATLLQTSANQWVWGIPHTGYRVVLGVVAGKSPAATVPLGPGTFGTPITNTASSASQSLYIEWAPNQWAEVLMTVPRSDSSWLEAIATHVRIS